MERKVSIHLYLGAFIIASAIFITGIYVGYLIDTSNLESISSDVSRVSQKLTSLNMLLLMEGNSSSFCPVYESELSSIDEEVELMGHKLSYIEEEKGTYDYDLKRQYFALEAGSYLLSEKVKDICGAENVLLIYFYSNTKCPECKEQGIEILKARDELQSSTQVKIYSFEGGIGSPIADALMDQFNAKEYPSIVIVGKTYSGYRDAGELKDIIEGQQ